LVVDRTLSAGTSIHDQNIKTMKYILFILLVICINSAAGQSSRKSYIINDTTVNAIVNERFELNFLACHDGGYSWFLTSIDTAEFKLLDKTSIPLIEQSVSMVGGNAVEIWSFKGFNKGIYYFDFYYKRPWLSETEKSLKIKVVIN